MHDMPLLGYNRVYSGYTLRKRKNAFELDKMDDHRIETSDRFFGNFLGIGGPSFFTKICTNFLA